MGKKKDKGTKVSGFIQKLVNLLQEEKQKGVIEYCFDSKSFTIKNIRRFTQQILAKYYKHRNFSSFVRQVNLYDFRKIKLQEKQQSYFHDSFDIYNKKMLKKIKRKTVILEKKEKVDDQNEEENDSESLMDGVDLEELTRKRESLIQELKKQQEEHEKLQHENKKLKYLNFQENQSFLRETLALIQNIMISQMNQGNIAQQMYSETMELIFKQRQLINQEYQSQQQSEVIDQESKNQGQGALLSENSLEQPSSFTTSRNLRQSKFWLLLTELMQNRDQLTIEFVLETIGKFARQETRNGASNNTILQNNLHLNMHQYKSNIIQKEVIKQQKSQIGSKRIKQCNSSNYSKSKKNQSISGSSQELYVPKQSNKK